MKTASARSFAFVVLALGAGAVASLITSCAQIERATPAPDASDGDAGAIAPDADSGDGGVPSSAPFDSECTEPWATTAAPTADCRTRAVVPLDASPAAAFDWIAIARTPAGRVGVAHPVATPGGLLATEILHFVPDGRSFRTTALRREPTGAAQSFGRSARLGASAPDTLHLASLDGDGDTGAVRHFRQAGAASGLAPAAGEVVGSALPLDRNVVGLGVRSADDVVVTFLVGAGTDERGAPRMNLAVRRRAASGSFTALPEPINGLMPTYGPGTGRTSIAFDEGGAPLLLVHACTALSYSTLAYTRWTNSSWSYPTKTVDGAAARGVVGFEAALGRSGAALTASYFVWSGLPEPSSAAELRVATWSGASSEPSLAVVEQGFSTAGLDPRFRSAMAVDPWGLVHLVFVDPSSAGTLRYRRQTRTAAGERWLKDVIAVGIGAKDDPYQALVDMVVDERGRPHIVYRSGTDGSLHYATRFDR